MGCPLPNPSLFTLKFDSLPQFYFLKQIKAFAKNAKFHIFVDRGLKILQ